MLRALLFAPLAGALVFASPAIGQVDNRPGAYQRDGEDQNASDEEDAPQRANPPERGRYAYRLDDDRDDARDVGDQFESYELESDRQDDRAESAAARDSRQRDRQDLVRRDRDRYAYTLEPDRNGADDDEGDQPEPGAHPRAPIHWNDREDDVDAPAAYRGEESRPDRLGALPRREIMEPAEVARTGMTRVMPARAVGGAHPTPRREHSYAEAIWHVRAALNVAALRCRDADEVRTVAAYNGLLSTRRATLAAADSQTKALYRARFGGRWQHMHDTAMTKLYNFFAQPPAHDDFCRVARQVLDEVRTVPDAAFAAFANDALARLEAPFTDSNRRADEYSTSRGSWQGATS